MRHRWDEAVTRLGGQPCETDLELRYAEPHRKYHNATHIEAVLRDVCLLSEEDDPVLTLAICAHDVIYDANPGEDERASALWSRRWLTEAKVATQSIARVESLILATITHQSLDPLARILLDADLAILAAHKTYTTGIQGAYEKNTQNIPTKPGAKAEPRS
jgi:predicted metal-dependent HD superfamily phosphohydrolase